MNKELLKRLHSTALDRARRHSTAFDRARQHSTALDRARLRSTAFDCIRLHSKFFISCFLFSISSFAAESSSVAASITLAPEQSAYYAGQTIRLAVEIVIADAELTGNLRINGLPDASFAENDGFTEIPATPQTVKDNDGVSHVINTKRYTTRLKFLREGHIEVTPVITGVSEMRQRRGMFATVWNQTPFSVAVEPFTLDIQPLPEAPANFSGAIGHFTVKASMTPMQASVGDLVNLRWTLEGIGNLQNFTPPALESSTDFKCYAAKEKLPRTTPTAYTYEQVIIPQMATSTNVPAITFTAFDPETSRYETLTIGPFPLAIKPRDNPFVPETTHDAPAVSDDMTSTLAERQCPCLAKRQEFDASAVSPVPATAYLAPSTSSMVLGEIPPDTTLHIFEQTNRWLRVQYNGTSVWINHP